MALGCKVRPTLPRAFTQGRAKCFFETRSRLSWPGLQSTPPHCGAQVRRGHDAPRPKKSGCGGCVAQLSPEIVFAYRFNLYTLSPLPSPVDAEFMCTYQLSQLPPYTLSLQTGRVICRVKCGNSPWRGYKKWSENGWDQQFRYGLSCSCACDWCSMLWIVAQK